MSELATFIKASMLLKRENIIPVDGPVPQWFTNIKKMISIGACVNDIPLDHRMPLLEKGSKLAAEAIQELEDLPDTNEKPLGMAYAHIAFAVFRSCFFELFPEADMTVLCYLMAINQIAMNGIPASDSLRASLFTHCVTNAFRRTRTGSQQMTPEKVSKMARLAMSAIKPKNEAHPTPAEVRKYCTLVISIASANLYLRQFKTAKDMLAPLLNDLAESVGTDNVDLSHQMINAYIIYVRCLTEENQMEPARAALASLMKWLGKSIDKIAPRKVISTINRWRPELSSAVNALLWTTLTAYQLKLVEANPTLFSIEELAQLLLLSAAHLCHMQEYQKAMEGLGKAAALIERLQPNTAGGTVGPLQLLLIRAWTLEGLAKRSKDPKDKQAKLRGAWDCLSAALNHRGFTDESIQVAIMAKMAWIGEQLPTDASIKATLATFTGEEGIADFIKDPQLIKWGQTLPTELLTPYWGLSF